MHEMWMREALSEAARSDGDVPVGAVAVLNGCEIARAHNEREQTGDPTAHAEVLALRRAAQKLGTRRLHSVTLYVTLEPCPMCAGALVMAEVSSVVFGAFDAERGCCGSVYDITQDPAFSHRVRVTGGVLEDACAAALNEFFASRRATPTA